MTGNYVMAEGYCQINFNTEKRSKHVDQIKSDPDNF